MHLPEVLAKRGAFSLPFEKLRVRVDQHEALGRLHPGWGRVQPNSVNARSACDQHRSGRSLRERAWRRPKRTQATAASRSGPPVGNDHGRSKHGGMREVLSCADGGNRLERILYVTLSQINIDAWNIHGIHLPAWMTLDILSANNGFKEATALMQSGKTFDNLSEGLQHGIQCIYYGSCFFRISFGA